MLEKIKKKIFGRKATNFELFSLTIGLTAGLISILSQLGFLSITLNGYTSDYNFIAMIVGIILLGLISFYIYSKKKDWVLSIVILILGILILLSGTGFLTTVFNPTGELGNIPLTQIECRQAGGIVIPSLINCPIRYVEVGGSKDFICCKEDTCENWKRVYNDNTGIFEFICQEG